MSLDNLKHYNTSSKILMAVRMGEIEGSYKNGLTLEEAQQILQKMGTNLSIEEIDKAQKGHLALRDSIRYGEKRKDMPTRTLGIVSVSKESIDQMLIHCGLLEGPKLKIKI